MSNKLLIKNKELISRFLGLINKNTIKNVVFFSGGIILFITGVIVYGIIINSREIPLSEAMRLKGFTELKNPNILVEKDQFHLKLYEDTVLIKTYKVNIGRNAATPKTRKGDLATPIGDYKICAIDTNYKYYKFFRLDYPNLNDAANALRKGLITQKEYDQLRFEYYYGDCPNLETELGGNIGIHGIGEYNFVFKNLPFVFNWTNGSIALSNEDVDELYSVVKKGTKVVIR